MIREMVACPFLTISYVIDTVLGSRSTKRNKVDNILAISELLVWRGMDN